VDEWAVHAMREKFKLISDGGNSYSKKCKWGHCCASGGFWRSLHLTEVWSHEYGFSHREDAFIFNLLYKEIL
jgi:hypothetical protein